MSEHASLFSSPPDRLLRLLENHLPHSLLMFRKLQYLKHRSADSALPEVIYTSNRGKLGDSDSDAEPEAFTVLFINTSSSGSTAMYVYSTIEDGRNDGADESEYERQLDIISQELLKLRRVVEGHTGKEVPDIVVLGGLNSVTRRLWEKTGRITGRSSSTYDNWILDMANVPDLGSSLPDGMVWDTVDLEDCRVVASRTDIPRPPEYLATRPNYIIKLEDKTPVAWAFLDTVGSLISVHCEEPFRKQGLARKVSAKLLSERVDELGPGGLAIAHVAPENLASRAMCKSLGGYPTTSVTWVNFNLAEVVEPAAQNGHV